jgi:hypothetical protein
MATLGQGGVEQVRCALLQQHVSVQGRLPPPLHCQGDYDSPGQLKDWIKDPHLCLEMDK